jgi:S1/P1 Nuclease
MRKFLIITYFSLCSLFLVSWGVLGHRAIGKIAENHLTTNSKQAIAYYLGNESLADVSNYADEIRSKEEYKYTAPWHYIDLPEGYDYEHFSQAVRNMKDENVYTALLKCENDLRDPSRSRDERSFALKFIVHLVGDVHQPMHVSRAEDKGGNSIKVTFNGQDANLHSLWDSRLIEHQNLSYEQLAAQYDHATAAQIRQWQSDNLMKWLFESYQISSQLYADARNNSNFDEAYYQAHLPVIQQRIEQAGIRLAGVLNGIFDGSVKLVDVPVDNTAAATTNSAALKSGENVTICEKVYSTKYFDGSRMTLLNLGAAYSNQKLTIMIRSEDRGKFKVAPDAAYLHKNICVTGVVQDYKGKPEIVVKDPQQIVIKD